jgi:hypothetical protein
MIHAWYSQETAHWFVYLSFFSLFGILGHYVKQGRYRNAVTAAIASCATVGASLLVFFVIAAIGRQPGYVLFSLAVPAIVISVVFGATLVQLPRQYTAAELRRIAAKEI